MDSGMGFRPVKNPFYRTKMCSFWQRGHCPYGERCTYIHPSPNDPLPPSMGRGPSMRPDSPSRLSDLDDIEMNPAHTGGRRGICRLYAQTGRCRFGDRCKFRHERFPGGYPSDLPMRSMGNHYDHRSRLPEPHHGYGRDPRDMRDFRDLRDRGDPRDMRDMRERDFRDVREREARLREQYYGVGTSDRDRPGPGGDSLFSSMLPASTFSMFGSGSSAGPTSSLFSGGFPFHPDRILEKERGERQPGEPGADDLVRGVTNLGLEDDRDLLSAHGAALGPSGVHTSFIASPLAVPGAPVSPNPLPNHKGMFPTSSIVMPGDLGSKDVQSVAGVTVNTDRAEATTPSATNPPSPSLDGTTSGIAGPLTGSPNSSGAVVTSVGAAASVSQTSTIVMPTQVSSIVNPNPNAKTMVNTAWKADARCDKCLSLGTVFNVKGSRGRLCWRCCPCAHCGQYPGEAVCAAGLCGTCFSPVFGERLR